MSYPGGIAAKHGDRYETEWTVHCVLEILRSHADSIELEPIGSEGVGIEFVIQRGEDREYHQVKRRNTGSGHWTLTALHVEGVIAAFARKLDEGAHVRFVSEQDADQLRVLAERAHDSKDLDDFLARLGGQTWKQHFLTLAAHMALDESRTFQALRRLQVTVIDEEKLRDLNEAWAEPLIDDQPAGAVAALADLVRASVPGELSAETIWNGLAAKFGRVPRRWRDDPALIGRVDELNDTLLAPLRALRLHDPIERPEQLEVRALLERGEVDGVLLTSTAGGGKSDLVAQVADEMRSDGWPVLYLRADRLEPALTPTELGSQLGLPGSPVAVLSAIASGKPSLIVIDQLDVVSVASGRITGLWDPLYALIRQASVTDGMRVLIACRQFDVDNDHRMRALTSEAHRLSPVTIPALTARQVDGAVSAMGLDATALTAEKRRLLEVPLHLVLLEASAEARDALDFGTVTELFDRFWAKKQRDASARLGRPVAWGRIVDATTTFMSDNQALSVPTGRLEELNLATDADALESEHVFVGDGHAYRFFHESFFDYAFARTYLSRGGTIRDLLEERDQDLFRRTQVRQLLAQQRDADFTAYLDALRDLLTDVHIRFHLKQLELTWLASLPDPRDDEVSILATVLIDDDVDDPRRPLVWRVFAQTPWFDRALDTGWVERWLGDPTTANAAIHVVGSVASERPDAALRLLREHDDGSSDWTQRLAYVARFGAPQDTRGMFELLLSLVDRDAFSGTNDHDAWLYGHDLPEVNAEWAAELLEVLLRRANERATRQGQPHALFQGSPLQHEYTAIEFVTQLADKAPASFLGVALPFVFEIVDAEICGSDEKEIRDDRLPAARVWAYRLSTEIDTFDDAILVGVSSALRTLAVQDRAAFVAWADILRQRRDETSQLILFEGLQGAPEANAGLAADVILDGPWRYWTANAEDPFWTTHQLLKAIAPYLPEPRVAELEKAVLGFTTPFERTAHGRRSRGESEFALLSGLPTNRLSPGALRRLRELQRKFGSDEPREPVGVIGGFVRSPISRESAGKMSDSDWLRAIASHRERWEEKRSMDLVGGAAELATVLQALAQEQPERFARLGLELPADTLDTYVEHLAIGLAQSDAGAEPASLGSVVALVRHLSKWAATPSARWLPRLVVKYADEPLPEDVIELVVDIALKNADPIEDVWQVDAGRGQGPYYGGDVLGAGMNSARGAAVLALASLVATNESRANRLERAIESTCRDATASVKACAAEAVYALMRWKRDAAVRDLLLLTDGPDRLLATAPVQNLFIAAIATHWSTVRPIVEQMLASDDPEVREAGGALATIGGLEETDANDLLQRVLEDSDARVRAGVAKVLAARAISSRYRERCVRGLEGLFDDEDAEVRAEAARVFWRARDQQMAELGTLSFAFLASKAFDGNHAHFLRALEASTSDVGDLVLATADRMLSSYGAELGNLQTRLGGDARHLSDLLLRVMGTLDGDRQQLERALDIFDLLLAAGAWGTTEALEAAER
jgi:hypothetical protein